MKRSWRTGQERPLLQGEELWKPAGSSWAGSVSDTGMGLVLQTFTVTNYMWVTFKALTKGK